VPEDVLVELLRKCHRDELLPLAEAMRIKPAGMKHGTLARAIDHHLRRAGAHDVGNILLRDGKGPPYLEVLRSLGKRLELRGAEHFTSADEAELAILREGVRRAWDDLDEEARHQLWTRMEVGPPMPNSPEEAVARAQQHHLQRFGYVAGTAGIIALRMLPLPGCLSLYWLAKPKDDVLLPAILEVSRLRQAVMHRVTVGVVGSPSSGKDAAIVALFGLDSGNVNPVAGSTKEVEITRLPDATALYVVNTPGMGDVVESVTEEAKQVLDHIDVFLYIVNAQGGVQAREKADYDACVRSGRPVLAVVNKIDTLREGDRERYLTDARAKLGVDEEDFLAAAFDPLPQLADAPIGLDEVRAWVERHLIALGKDPRELPWVQGAREEHPGIQPQT
jgi:GTP-binding protein EngB required for normal cell division